MLHAAGRRPQLLPDVDREVVRGEEGDWPLDRQVRLGQRHQAALLPPSLHLIVIGLSFLVVEMVLNGLRLDHGGELVGGGSIFNSRETSHRLT